MVPDKSKSSDASARLPSSLIAGISLTFAAILSLAGYFLWQSRAMLHERAANNAETLVNVLEQFVFTSIHESEVLLQMASDEYRRELQAGRYDPNAFADYLTFNRKRIPAIANLRVSDASGQIRFGENGLLERPADISDRPYFAAARDNGNRLVISPPVLGRISQEWVIPVAWRLDGPAGRFDGLLVANLQTKKFTDLFASLKSGPNSVVVLFDADASINLRYPEPKGPGSTIGRKIGSPEFKEFWQQGIRTATYRAQSTTDGIWRTYSYRQVGNYPLFVMLGVAEDDIMAPWKMQAAITATALVILGILLTLVWVLQRKAMADQRKAAAELRQSETRLATILDSLEATVYVSDMNTHEVLFINRYLRDMIGDVVGQLCWKTLQSGMNGPCDFCTTPYLLATDGTPNDTYIWENFNPALGRWFQRHDRAIPWTDGHLVRMQIAIDITERKLAKVALQEKAEELLRSNAELEQFSYSISHDMRQPLRMISSYLQLLQNGLGDTLNAEQREYFHFAIDGAQRLDAMLRGLLDYSRVGRKGEPPAWIESRTALDEALLFLRPLVAEAQAEICIEGEWPRLLASPDELLRLLQNLIGNALKFRVEGRPPVVIITSQVIAGHWRLNVADNGVGILPDQIDRLFQVFQRLQARATYEGTGIGLALCRKIAEHLGGRIWAESAGEGQGSRFCLELPLRREDGEASA